jgi:hypothetical protein
MAYLPCRLLFLNEGSSNSAAAMCFRRPVKWLKHHALRWAQVLSSRMWNRRLGPPLCYGDQFLEAQGRKGGRCLRESRDLPPLSMETPRHMARRELIDTGSDKQYVRRNTRDRAFVRHLSPGE